MGGVRVCVVGSTSEGKELERETEWVRWCDPARSGLEGKQCRMTFSGWGV
jgi:hypothetical protein